MPATAHQVVILKNDYNGPAVVVAEKPAHLSEQEALELSQRIYAESEAAQTRHYDRYARGDYDILSCMEKRLKKAGFTVLHSHHNDF